MKKVVSTGLGMLLAIVIALPAAADQNGGDFAGALRELYSTIAGWFADELDLEALESMEAGSSMPVEQTSSNGGPSQSSSVTTEMTPMTLPGG